jgi:prophage regulatory protein
VTARLPSAAVGPLVSRIEIAEMLGVSQQRVHQLLAKGDFPPPLADLAIGQIWERRVVEEWARDRGRLPIDDEDES